MITINFSYLAEVNEEIVQCKQIINKIMIQETNKSLSTGVKEASSHIEMEVSIPDVDVLKSVIPAAIHDASQNVVEPKVKIPLSYLLKAEPLISLLVSCKILQLILK